MNKTTIQKISERFRILLKDKRIYIGLIILLAIFANIAFSTKKENVTPTSTKPTEKPIEYKLNFKKDSNNDIKRIESQSYLLNGHDTLSGVVNFSWKANEIIYATKSGVYNLWKNQKLFTATIDTIEFSSSNNKAVFNNSDGLFLLDLETKESKKIYSNIPSFKINDNGNYLLFVDGKNLITINLINTQIKTSEIKTDTTDHKWIANSNKFYIYDSDNNIISVYDTDFQKLNAFSIEKGSNLAEIDPLSQNIIFERESEYFVQNLQNNKVSKISIKDYNNHAFKWLTTDKILLIAKKDRGFLDLYDQDIYLFVNNKIEYLTSSVPIKGKVNTLVYPKINKDNTAIALLENNGKIWTISLIPNKLPSLTENGIGFYNIPSIIREGSH
jgi:hypothetical protein